ncbi:MAG: hypothetical protein IPJ97_03780 [Proteobacteria bacterium]|nr:hypothetical protein [Pseudomonadota bacterium]
MPAFGLADFADGRQSKAPGPVSVPASGKADTLAGTETGPGAAGRRLSKFSADRKFARRSGVEAAHRIQRDVPMARTVNQNEGMSD